MSTMTAQARGLTPDDVLQMPDGKRYELVDGRLVEQEMSFKSQYAASELALILGT